MALNIAPVRFPWDVFHPNIYTSFKNIAYQNNIPLDYCGTQALFCIASLAGNMFIGDMNGGIKPIVFIAKIGPSGVGKSPAYNKLMGDIISPLRHKYNDEYKESLRQWKQRQRDAKNSKMDFDEEEPAPRIRIVEGGTVEALAKHSITSPAGFGVYYDEGERMFDELNKYNNGGTSVAFWNEVFNGKTVHLVRVDSTRERFIPFPAISLDIGLQTDRMGKYFTPDAIESGILNRFLLVESGHINLNEDVNLFGQGAQVCEEWSGIIHSLFRKGLSYEPGTAKKVAFDAGAQQVMTQLSRQMIRRSNIVIKGIRDGDATKLISNYRSKLFTYFPRLALILAIMKTSENPVITQDEVFGAQKLCEYYEYTAIKILRRLFDSATSGLTPNEQKLIDALPDEFTTDFAILKAQEIGLSAGFFQTAFRRKYSKGFIYKVGRMNYEKN